MSVQNLGESYQKVKTALNLLDEVADEGYVSNLDEILGSILDGTSIDDAAKALKSLKVDTSDLGEKLVDLGYDSKEAFEQFGSSGTKSVSSLGTAFSGLAAKISIPTTALGTFLGVAAGVAVVFAAVQAHNANIQKLVDRARESASAWSESNSTLESYVDRVGELRDALDSGTLSEEEAYQAKSELLSIQQALSDSYGDQADGIDLINGKIEEQIGLIERLSTEEANKLLNEEPTGIAKAEKEMNKKIGGANGAFLGEYYHTPDGESAELDKILAKYSDTIEVIQHTGDLNKYVYFHGDATEAKETLHSLMTDLRNASNDFEKTGLFDTLFNNASGYLEEANEILNTYQALYKTAQTAKLIADTEAYGLEGQNGKTAAKWLSDYATAIENYNTTLASGDSSQIDEAAESFKSVDDAIQHLLENGMSEYSDQFGEVRDQLNEAAIAGQRFIDILNGKETINGVDHSTFANEIKELDLTDVDIKYAINTDGLQDGEVAINRLIIAAMNAGLITGRTEEDIQAFIDILVRLGMVSSATTGAIDDLSTATESLDFTSYQSIINEALESSKSAIGLTTEQVENITTAYKNLENFDPSRLFEETANGIHLNQDELSRLNEELAANELAKYTDLVREKQEEIYRLRAQGADTSSLESELADAKLLKSQYEGLTSAYNKWLDAQSGGNERDSYEGVGSSYKEMKAILDQGWYGDESLNAYLDLMLSVSERTGDAQRDFKKLKQTIKGTNHSLMDYWKYDDDELVTDGLFDFLDDVNKKFGDSYAAIGEDGKYAFDLAGDKLQEVADGFGMSTEMVELFARALIDAGMTVNMGDLTLPEEIDKAIESLKKFKEEGLISDSLYLDFNIDTDSLEDLKDSIDDLKDERVKIDAKTNPKLSEELDDLIAKCEEQYYFRLNAETDGSLDAAIAIVERMKVLTQATFSVETQVENEQELNALASTLASLPPEVQTAVGITTNNTGNALGILDQLKTAPTTINTNINYIPNEQPDPDDKEASVNYVLGEQALPKNESALVNYKLGKQANPLNKTAYIDYIERTRSDGAARAEGTTILNHYRATHAYANSSNWALPKNEKALVNEIGTESIVRDGKWHLIPGGAHVEQLKKGDIIFSAAQTEELLRTGKVTSGGGHGRIALADGTAYNTLNLSAYADPIGSGGSRRPVPGTTSSYKSPSSSAKNSTSTSRSSDDEIETLDWIEVAVSRIERVIDRLKTTVTSTYKALKSKLGATLDEISMVNQELAIQQRAYDRYMQEANNIGLSSDLAALVQNGAIDISQYDEDTSKLIQEYQDFYEKALSARDVIDDLKESLASLYEGNFNNIQEDYDNQIELLEHLSATYENGLDELEAKGYLASTSYYKELQNVEQQRIDLLNKELSDLEKSFSEAMNSGEIEEYSSSWFEMQQSINDTKEAIQEATIALAEYEQQMRELEWEHFDYRQDRISALTSESDFMIDLISNDKMHDENGKLTDEGMATMGLHGQNYNVYMAQADQYASEIEKINAELANDPNNTTLIERREELLELQRESILAAEDEKQAMVSLVEEGIKAELDAMQELINAYVEALDSAKDLYDYQRKIADYNSEISSLEKQLSAYEGDTSEETKAKIQQIQVELENANQDLAQAEYDQYISDQKKLLDELYTEFEASLNQRIDNIDALLEEMIGSVNANSESINQTLTDVSEEVGYAMTDEMQSIWNDSTNAIDGTISVYGDDFTNKLTSINSVLDQICANTDAMITASNTEAEEAIGNAASTTTPAPSVGATTPSSSATTNQTSTPTEKKITIGGKINAKGAKIYDYAGDTSGENQYYKNDPIYTVLGEESGYLKVRHHKLSSGVTGWFKKSDVKAYKTGGLVDYTGLAWLDGTPGKPETVLDAEDTENLIELRSYLRKLSERGLDFVNMNGYNFDATSHLASMVDVSSMVDRIRNYEPSDTSTSFGDINISIPIEHIDDYNDLVNKLRDDDKFEKMIQSMTIDRIAGKSSLAKYKYTWSK